MNVVCKYAIMVVITIICLSDYLFDWFDYLAQLYYFLLFTPMKILKMHRYRIKKHEEIVVIFVICIMNV